MMDKPGIALLLIFAAVFAVFSPSLLNNFTNWDDGAYVSDNIRIRSLSLPNIASIVSSFHMSAYQPMALLCFALEYRVFKLNPSGYHLVSIFLHIINCMLVFWLVFLLGGSVAWAFLTALLFGVHPVQVESVAWVSETKGLLSALFFFGALISYIYYLKKGRRLDYLLSLGLFALSLLSKGATVVLPAVLFLIDYFYRKEPGKRPLPEKAPFFALAFTMAAVTVIANSQFSRVGEWGHLSLFHKAAFPFYSAVFYLGRIIFPYKISCLYPYPGWTEFILFIVLFFMLAAAVYLARRNRKVVFGALFFIICLIPAMQFVEVGKAAVADRYAYFASAGIFFLVGALFARFYGGKDQRGRTAKGFLCAAAIFCVIVLSALSQSRIPAWKDSFTLWNDALKKGESAVAYNNRGVAYDKEGSLDLALSDYESALKADPRFFEASVNKGNIYYKKGDYGRAISEYKKAAGLNPKASVCRMYLASVYLKLGRFADAVAELDAVLRIYPRYSEAHYQRGLAGFGRGDYAQAVRDFSRAIELSPDYGDAYVERANAYYLLKEYDLAQRDIRFLEKNAVKVDPRAFKAFDKSLTGK